jgi:DNA repair protein RadC
VFKVVHLNTANVIIGDYTVSEGGLFIYQRGFV